MSIVALSRNPSRTIPGLKTVMAFGNLVWRLIDWHVKTGRDERVLQMLPDNVLADMGLERMEVMSGTNGGRHVRVIPHRYH